MEEKRGLKRGLGMFTGIMVVVSAMIGSGVFKKSAQMSAELGSEWAVLACWFLAGLITLMGALSNAEIAGKIAKAGGQYVYFKRMYGKLPAFLYGWSSFAVIQTATTASVAFVFAESLQEIFVLPNAGPTWTNLHWGDFYPFRNFGVKLFASIAIVLITLLNARGVKYGGFLSNLLASTILVSMAILVFAGFFLDVKSPELLSVKPVASVASTVNISTFFTAMVAAFWAFEGWNTVGFLGAEIKNPKRVIPIALGLGVLIVLLNYLLVNASFFHVLSIEHFVAFQNENNLGGSIIPAMEVIRVLLGKQGAILLACLIILSTFNSTNNTVMTSPRVYYAMAHDKLWWKKFATIDPVSQTPVFALFAHGLLSILFVWSGSFDSLTDMLVFAAFIFYGAGAWGVFRLRKLLPNAVGSFTVPSFVPFVFTAFSLILVVNSLWVNPKGSLTGLGLVLAGIPVYFYFVYKRKTENKKSLKTKSNVTS
jgi:APA family basic amino acid/polyamine antiporter